jgi:hypothetical protein
MVADNKEATYTESKILVVKLRSSLKKSLKIPKRQSESAYRRRTDNTMTKRKSTKGQTTIYQNIHIKLKIE